MKYFTCGGTDLLLHVFVFEAHGHEYSYRYYHIGKTSVLIIFVYASGIFLFWEVSKKDPT